MSRIIRWLRAHGLAPFGYAQENFGGHHQLLHVWGPLMPARWEVYRWPVGTGSDDLKRHMRPLPFGSSEAYHRIQLSAEKVYSGKDWDAAKRAFAGVYPDGTTDASRGGDDDENCPRCHQYDCTTECIAAEQAEIDADPGPIPRKFA